MSRVEDLTNYQVNESPSILEIRTERVEPLSTNATDRIYTFKLEPQGYLDANSLLQFRLNKASTSVNSELRVNSFNGALGAIKRVIFSVGDWQMNDTDGVNQIMTLMNMANKRRVNLNKHQAWYYGNQLKSKVSEEADETYGQVIPDVELGGYNYDTSSANSLEISATPSLNFKYGIKLGTLIPALRNQQIPLYLFDQYRIYISVEFHPASVYCNADTTTSLRANDLDVSIANVQLLTDYVIYPSSVLESQRLLTEKEGGVILDFLDWKKIERQLVVAAGTQTAVASNANYAARGTIQDLETVQDFRLGMEGKEVHTLVQWKQFGFRDGATAESKVFLGQRCDGISEEDIQWEINGTPVFPSSITSTASMFDQCNMALGYTDLQNERSMFFNDRNSLVANFSSTASGLLGTYKPQMYDLKTSQMGVFGSGTRVGRYPIQCKYKCSPALSLTTYGAADSGNISTSKQDGTYNVDFFVATSRRAIINNTPKGMVVSIIE